MLATRYPALSYPPSFGRTSRSGTSTADGILRRSRPAQDLESEKVYLAMAAPSWAEAMERDAAPSAARPGEQSEARSDRATVWQLGGTFPVGPRARIVLASA